MTFRQLLSVVEIRTKVVSVSTFVTAALYALRETGSLRPMLLAVSFVAVLAVDMGTTAFNSFFDWWRGNDMRRGNKESDKVILHEGVPALAALIVALACYTVGALLGLFMALYTGLWIVLFGALSFAAGFLYNGGPFPISRTPLGELVSGGFLGTMLFMIVYRVQAGAWGLRPLIASLPGMLLIASILTVNNTCDREADRASGRLTLSLLMGGRWGERLALVLGGASFGASILLALSGVLPPAVAIGSAVAGLASLPVYRRMLLLGFSQATKRPCMAAVLQVFLLWSAGFVAGLLPWASGLSGFRFT
ncbi:MAG TPA: prenyltransferase [Rectinemataceae bacterium]|nr:prenyltransferase [Rectinemataceae bacterium]